MSLRLQAVTKRYGSNTIFENLDLALGHGEKVALIGANGSGKSTLLRLIAGLEQPDHGSVHVVGAVSFLEQHPAASAGTALEQVAPAQLKSARAELTRAETVLTEATEANLARFAEAEERFRTLGGYEFAARAEAALAGLGVDPDRPVLNLSGGQQRRVLLARQLLAPGAVLLLDEPTNHLDTAGLEWLEEWVRRSPATLLIVSHDRAFLDATVGSVAELERGQLTVWPGNYTEAMELKAVAQAAQLRQHEAQSRQKKQLELEASRLGSVSRSAGKFNHRRAGNQALILAKAKAENVSRTMARRAKALEKRIEQMEITAAPYEENVLAAIPLPDVPSGPGDVLRFEDVTLERGGRVLVSGLNLLLRRGEKLALLGPNGSGKSSLIAAALGDLEVTTGRVVQGAGLTYFHVSQHGEELAAFATLEDAVRDAQPVIRKQDLHYLLARMGLPPEPTFRVADLSGGQRTRLSLARLTVTRAPLLVLDEPTNHLDIRMVEALEKLLVEYPGTILLASHDRRLVKAVATRTLHLAPEPR
ncbi:MAG: ABC-F family ATP-binding cassette domain-containing protein [Trueperaceae bacterium]